MKSKRRIIFIMTCLLFMIGHSSILETKNFNRELNIFVKENNLSHEELNEIIGKINRIKNINNRKLKKELKRIGNFKSLKDENDNFHFLKDNKFKFEENVENTNYIVFRNTENIPFDSIKRKNNLRIRE